MPVITQTVAGTYSWTVPTGVTSATVECWGAGGGGGGAAYAVKGGSGGGGGEYRSSVISVTPGATIPFVVGAGGAGGTGSPSVNGSSGTASTFNTTVVVANAGGGGQNSTGVPGSGGSGGTGTTGFNGGAGFSNTVSVNGGGGASSAGTASAGVSATSQTGATAPSGGGNGGTGATGSPSAANGSAGSNPGGGGGAGAAFASPPVGSNGGKGADGKVVITYYNEATVRGSNTFVVPTGTSTLTVTLPVTTKAGDVIIVATSGGGTTSFSMSGGSTTTWSIPGNNVGVAPTVWTMLGYNVPAGVTSATLNYSNTGGGSGACAVISGLISGNPVIQSGNGSCSASTSATASITNAVKPSNFLFYATSHFGATSESGNWSPDLVNFTQLQFSNSNSRPVGIDYKYPAALGVFANQAQVTYNNSNNGGLTVLELGVGSTSGGNFTMMRVG